MPADHAERPSVLPRPDRARVAARLLGAVVAALVAYAAWHGYHSPDFLLRVAAAFGLC